MPRVCFLAAAFLQSCSMNIGIMHVHVCLERYVSYDQYFYLDSTCHVQSGESSLFDLQKDNGSCRLSPEPTKQVDVRRGSTKTSYAVYEVNNYVQGSRVLNVDCKHDVTHVMYQPPLTPVITAQRFQSGDGTYFVDWYSNIHVHVDEEEDVIGYTSVCIYAMYITWMYYLSKYRCYAFQAMDSRRAVL